MDPLARALTRHLTVTGRTRILDASAGSGVRLSELAEWLSERPAYRLHDMPGRALVDSLYGVSDRPAEAASRLAAATGIAAEEHHVSSGDPLAFEGVPVQGDLFGPPVIRRPPAVFQMAPFDAVVADVEDVEPLDAARKDEIRARYLSAVGRFTYEAPLTERLFELVREGGLAAFRLRIAVLRRDFGRVLAARVLAQSEVLQIDDDGVHATIVLRRQAHLSSRSSALLRTLGEQDVAQTLRALEERATASLGQVIAGTVGRTSTPGCDEVWRPPPHSELPTRPLVRGEDVFDWRMRRGRRAIWPYDDSGERLTEPPEALIEWLSRFRPYLQARRFFGGSLEDRGVEWFEYVDHHPDRWRAVPGIVMRRFGTHVRAAWYREPVVVSGTALSFAPADEKDGWRALGMLGSSLGTLWCKQAFHVYETADGRAFEATAQGLESMPLPPPTEWMEETTRELDRLGREIVPLASVIDGEPEQLPRRLDEASRHNERIIAAIDFHQEELDWAVYTAFGLTGELRREASSDAETVRVFELDEPPDEPALGARWSALHDSELLSAVESWEYKRRVTARRAEVDARPALREWLVGRVASLFAAAILPRDRPVQVEEVDAVMSGDHLALAALTLLGEPLAGVMLAASVPYEPLRLYSASGLEKIERSASEAESFTPRDYAARGSDVPPCSPTAHRRRMWRLRGRYGAPREHFIHLADLSEMTDEPTFAWAGSSAEDRLRIDRLVVVGGAEDQLDLEKILAVKAAVADHPGSRTAELARRMWTHPMSYREVRLALSVLKETGIVRRLHDEWYPTAE